MKMVIRATIATYGDIYIANDEGDTVRMKASVSSIHSPHNVCGGFDGSQLGYLLYAEDWLDLELLGMNSGPSSSHRCLLNFPATLCHDSTFRLHFP